MRAARRRGPAWTRRAAPRGRAATTAGCPCRVSAPQLGEGKRLTLPPCVTERRKRPTTEGAERCLQRSSVPPPKLSRPAGPLALQGPPNLANWSCRQGLFTLQGPMIPLKRTSRGLRSLRPRAGWRADLAGSGGGGQGTRPEDPCRAACRRRGRWSRKAPKEAGVYRRWLRAPLRDASAVCTRGGRARSRTTACRPATCPAPSLSNRSSLRRSRTGRW